MGDVVETVKTINSLIRTISLGVLVGIVGTGGYYAYSHITSKDRELRKAQSDMLNMNRALQATTAENSSLRVEVAEKAKRIEVLETALHLLKTDQRLARIKVTGISKDEQGIVKNCQLEFVELSPSGEPLSEAKKIEMPSDVIYIDNWVVKFEDKYVEQADIERGTSLVLFRRIFAENQQPAEGVSLDEIGMRPQAYARGGVMSEFEKKLWGEFWEFANNPKKASELGIRAANGEAISIQVREGMSYDLQLRSSGGLSFKAVE